MRNYFALMSILICLTIAAFASERREPERVEYVVDLKDAQTQTCRVSMTVRNWQGLSMDVCMPVWRPGRYEVLELAGAVSGVTAADPAGKELPLEKTGKACWRVNTLGVRDVVVSYRLYANSLSARTRHVDDTHAFLSPAAVFMYCPDLRGSPVRVLIEAPAAWAIASGMRRDPADPRALLAPDYDALVDSPIEAGVQERREFEARGVPHEIVIWGDTKAVPERVAGDFAKIAGLQHDLFGAFPYKQFVFLMHVAPGVGGGTEHENSTIIQTRPGVFESPKDYRNFLALASHELFHTWNIKQFRPAGLKPYDYQRENYTDLLWVAEGATSYYDELLCVRAGVWEPKHYFETLAKLIDAEMSRPGGAVQPLADSSFDAWIKFTRPTPDSVNTTVSFYNKGALVNLLLDVEIRDRTRNAKSLDDVMRELYRRFPLDGPGYSTQDLLGILRKLTGTDFAPFFASYVRGTEPMPLTAALGRLGLELKRDAKKEDEPEQAGYEEAYTGLEVRDAEGAAVVTAVRSDGPAYGAGLIADDAIVALDGRRLRAGDMAARLKKLKAGDLVTVTYFRRDELRTATFALAARPRGELKISRVKQPTAEQKGMYEGWMGKAWE